MTPELDQRSPRPLEQAPTPEPEPDGLEAPEPTLRARLRAPLVAVLVLAVTGALAAAVLRPFLGAPSTAVDRAAQRRGGAQGEVVSLDRIRRERPGAGEDASAEGPARATTVIGVGTGRFVGASGSPDVEDPDGPPDPSEMRPPSDAEVQRDLAAFRGYIEGVDPRKGAHAYIDKHGRLVLPKGAPRKVALVVAAANEIATKPYKWGGGHGAWKDSGYDCSGSVSYALAGARLLDRPLDSSGLMRYGSGGPGRWIAIYANPGHVFMTVAGFRFDTSGQGAAGTRWQRGSRPTAGYAVRHPTGL